MSQNAVEDVFGRALTDRGFRERLLADGPSLAARYDLTDGERQHVLTWTAATFDAVTRRIDAELDAAVFDGIGFQPESGAATALRRFTTSVLPELTADALPPDTPRAEARLREAGIVRHLSESSLRWGTLRLSLCSGLYGGPYRNDRYVLPGVAGGRGLTAVEARAAAVAEAAERFAAGVCDRRQFVREAAANLADDAVAPSAFALFSDRQYAEPGFPYVRFDDDTCINWTWGRALLADRGVLVPAQFVHQPYWRCGREARLADLPTTGLACGRSLEEAALNGVYEVIERDAIMIAWLNRLAAPRVEAEAPGWAAAVPGERTLSIHDISTDLGIPVRLAIVINRAEHVVGVGAACQLDPHAASVKAAAEAAALEQIAGRVRRRTPAPAGESAADVRTMDDHLLFYSHPDRMRELDFLLRAQRRDVRGGSMQAAGSAADGLDRVLRVLQQHALDAVVVDLTLPEVAAAGLRVVRAMIPGLIPMTFGQRFAAKGARRLYRVPVELGYRTTALGEDNLNPAPHPFA